MSITKLGRYTRIDHVTQTGKSTIFDAYLLTGDDIGDGFELDLIDACFNEFDITKRETIKNVNSLDEVKQFAAEHGRILKDYDAKQFAVERGYKVKDSSITEPCVIIGGSEDGLLYSDLTFGWNPDYDIFFPDYAE